MDIPRNIIANADDLGYNNSVNKAILYCFENEYINSTSLMTNTPDFAETVSLIHENSAISNVGIHIDLAEGKPLTNFREDYLNDEGNWDIRKTNRALNFLNTTGKAAFAKEINAQIDKALSEKIKVQHIDSHLHLHTLPCFYKLFLVAAQRYKIKIRLAQTYSEGSRAKFYYRKYVNLRFIKKGYNYSDRFETVDKFLDHKEPVDKTIITEVMLHPWFDAEGILADRYDRDTLKKWITFLEN